MIFAYGMYPKE